MVKPSSTIADKQVRRAAAAADDYAAGVANPERPWKESTLKASAKRKANLEAAEREKRWEKAIAAKSEADWQNKATTLGKDRYAGGVEANKDKIDNFWAKFGPELQGLQDKIRAMPDATPEDRTKRMLANLEGMKALKGTHLRG